MTGRAQEFLSEVVKLQEKHGMVLVPTVDGEASMHDPLIVIKLDQQGRQYMKCTKEE